MIRDFDGVNGLSRAYDIGYDDGYQNGRADAIDELEQKLRVWDNKANAIPDYVWHCFNEIKEQKDD